MHILFTEHLASAKVDDLDVTLLLGIDEDVLGLQVSVGDLLVVAVVDGL